MLADTPSPHGSGATLASVGTLSEGFERSVASPLYLVGYVRWDARSDRLIGSSFPCQTINPTALQVAANRDSPAHLANQISDFA